MWQFENNHASTTQTLNKVWWFCEINLILVANCLFFGSHFIFFTYWIWVSVMFTREQMSILADYQCPFARLSYLSVCKLIFRFIKKVYFVLWILSVVSAWICVRNYAQQIPCFHEIRSNFKSAEIGTWLANCVWLSLVSGDACNIIACNVELSLPVLLDRSWRLMVLTFRLSSWFFIHCLRDVLVLR